MKNYLFGSLMLLLAFYLMWEQGSRQSESYEERNNFAERNESTIVNEDSSYNLNSSRESNQSDLFLESTSVNPVTEETFSCLENQYSSLLLTNISGGVRQISLKKHDRLSQDYLMIHSSSPMLGLSFEDTNGNPLDQAMNFSKNFKKIEDVNFPNRIIYRWELKDKLQVDRHYWRDDNASYSFKHATRITNLNKDNPVAIGRAKIFLGSAFQIPRKYNPFDNSSTYLNVGYYNSGVPLAEGCSCAECSGRIDGQKEEFIQVNEMGPSGKMETRTLGQAKWACVNNQFFVNLIRPEAELRNVQVSGNSVQIQNSDTGEEVLGVEGSISFPVGIFQPLETKEFSFEVYGGPKDYMGLSALGGEQKKVMQFGIFWWISEPFNWILNKLFGLLGSYGLAIIVLTILVKLVLWPLTAQATRSQKKMQSLQEPMSKLREKHKGNSQKLNQEMMKFYKEHKVNPFAGCWPILIQIPIFLGMFWMLRSAAELYGQGFLWAEDLSEQDSINVVQGFSLNLLPILMVVTQWFQMKLNPMQMGPEMSEAQRLNVKMMRFMPFMFLVFLYFFSSALVLYWTIQNLMTILQTLVTKTKTPEQAIAGTGNQKLNSGSLENEESDDLKHEISEEERKYKNLMGLRAKGKIDLKLLEKKYSERLLNYSEEKLSQMSAAKRRIAMDKKDRLQQAYNFLRELGEKQS